MLIPAVVVALSGVLTLVWHPSHQARSLIQHFAAGVVIAVLAVEVLPELTREHAPNWVLISSFAFGVFFMYMMKIFSEHLEAKAATSGSEGMNIGLISTVFIDAAVDGLIIGAGFAASKETGFILAIGLSVEMLFLGLSLVSNTMKGWRIVYAPGAICYTDVPTSAFQYIRQRLRWERDAIWIRFRKHRRLMNPFDNRFGAALRNV